MVKLDLKELKLLKNKLDVDDKAIIDEFVQVCNEVDDMDELDEYVDLLLGIAENIEEEDQEIIYSVISKIQE